MNVILKILCLLLLFAIVATICFCKFRRMTPHEFLFPNEYTRSCLREELSISQYDQDTIRHCSFVILVAIYNIDCTWLRKRITYLFGECQQWKLFLYGLDSTDNRTRQQLILWAKQDYHHVILVPPSSSIHKKMFRTERIATIRNTLLRTATLHSDIQNYECLLVYDGDLLGPMSKSGLADAVRQLKSQKQIFAVAACGIQILAPGFHIIYDSFAYRDLKNRPYGWQNFYWRLVQWSPDYRHVKSAFNGATLYRWNELQQLQYPIPKTNVCEHVLLHEEIRKKFGYRDMIISKKWIILAGMSQPKVD